MAANLITNYLPGTGQQVWFFHTNSYSAT
jgi:hypothetical protein